jgi:V8-like Glu-specific endopeptidase
MLQHRARLAVVLFVALLAMRPDVAFGQQPIGPATVKQTKQATVYLKVTTAGGQVSEGSGFLLGEPGIVITNAHVVGMLQAKAKPPTKVEIVINSGEADEAKVAGAVLGVDRDSDLAVLRIEGKQPAPLQLGAKDELFETQKVYIFGFPFGEQLGKNITVSESSVSSLRKDAKGVLEQIQVNGGMHPGNSGGPVINAQGKVIGVAVAGIRATQINFAVPAARVQSLLDGRIQEAKPGELFRQKDEVRVPLHYACLDPFNKIKEVRVEVWTGKADPNRKFLPDKAQPAPGDGARLAHALKFEKGTATADVLLPTVGDGQVAWVQPILIFAKGEPQFGAPQAFEPKQAIERLAAELAVKQAEQKERTVHLKSSQTISLSKGKLRYSASASVELDLIESFSPDPRGHFVQLGFGRPTLAMEEDGKKRTPGEQIVSMLERLPPGYQIGEINQIHARKSRMLTAKVNPELREQVNDFHTQLCNAYEASNIILPNRKLQPRETWQVELPLLIKSLSGKAEVFDLVLTCTHEGVRTAADNPQALITFTGRLAGRKDLKDKLDGQVAGRFTFDSKRGYISSVQMTVTSESSSTTNDIQGVFTFDIALTRSEGNPLKIALPKVVAPPPSAEAIVRKVGILSAKDPLDTNFAQRGSRVKSFTIHLEKDKKYTIALTSTAFDPYLRLIDPKGKVVAEDDDSGGDLNSRIDHTATMTGEYKVVVTAFDGKLGSFLMQVFGDAGAAKLVKDDPKVKPDDPKVKPVAPPAKAAFVKPAKSDKPMSYLKVVSSPGDYIGQGKTYEFTGDQLDIKKTPRGVKIKVDGWTLDVGAPVGQFLAVGEHQGAKRHISSKDAPGISFVGKGRVSTKITGAFVVWELEVEGDRIVRLAIDFVQYSDEKGVPLTGKIRVNSNLQ